MNCPVNGSFNIEIDNGGSFIILDYDDNNYTRSDYSIISSAIPDGKHRFHFYVKKGAIFQMKNSELHECGYILPENPTPWIYEGLYIETSNPLIENSIITNNNVGIRLYYYCNNTNILNTRISNNLRGGLIIWGVLFQVNNIRIENCFITSNGQMSSTCSGISLWKIDNLEVNNSIICHNSKSGIECVGEIKYSNFTNCQIINNNYGFSIGTQNVYTKFENNTILGNLDYAIYNYGNEYINVENNYFGSKEERDIKSSIFGNNVSYNNWQNSSNSNILHINNSMIWGKEVKYLDEGLLINGDLTIENSNIFLNNSDGKNFIQVNGRLIIKNSTINYNQSNPDLISIFGFYSFLFSVNSSGYLMNVTFYGQKGINILNDNMRISRCNFIGKYEFFQRWGLFLKGNFSSIEKCNFSNFYSGIQINSENNTISQSNFELNGNGILSKTDNNRFINNSFSQNYLGISLTDSMFNNINCNNFTNNTVGVYIYESSNNLIYYCSFINNTKYGIEIFRSDYSFQKPCEYNKILYNNFDSNGKIDPEGENAIDQWNKNIWNNSYPLGGNFWNDYTGKDLFSGENQSIIGSDGFGDKPYNIPGKIYGKAVDHFPLMYPVGIPFSFINTPFLYDIESPDPDGNFTLSWTSVLNATNYTVYEVHEGFTNTTDLGPITNLKITGKSNDTYQYYVQAKNDKVLSKRSNTITVVVDYPPEIPRGLTAIPLPEGNTLELKWLINNVDIINYSLWSNHTGLWKELDNITHPMSTFIHNGLNNGQKYYYKIKAWDGINQSSKFSKIIYGIPGDIVPPAAPIELKASTISNSSIELTWESNNESDLAGYDLYRTASLELNFSKINIEPIINSSFLDNGLTGNTTYYYKLLAYDEVPNYSLFSNIAFNTTYLTSPRVISYSPRGINVLFDSKIEIVFSKPMNKASVKQGLKINPAIEGNIFWENDQQTIIFQPENDLLENTTYNVTLVNPILDLEGGMLVRTFSWEFRTIELPRIIQYFPQGDFVNTDTVILIIFNRDMNKTSVQEAFSIDHDINGTFSWINDKKFAFEPDSKLPELTTYEITIDYLAQDLIGNIIGEDFSWSFRTGDFTVPDIISYSPTDDGVAVDTQVSIVFSEPMNKSRVENNLIITPDIDGEFQWRGNTLVFLPDKNLKYDTKYTITLSSDAADKWGNPLANDLSWEFVTEKKSSDDDQSIGYNIVLIIGIIVIVIILIVIIISVILRKRRESSTGDVIQEQDETLEE
jgi:parallel beta-helix repeat protein